MNQQMFEVLCQMISDVKDDTRETRELARATNGRVSKLEAVTDQHAIDISTLKSSSKSCLEVDYKTVANIAMGLFLVAMTLYSILSGTPLPIF